MLHAVLIRHGGWFGVKEVAEQARVSSATASQVLAELERFDWVVSRGQGPRKERQLREPGALLDAWAKQLAVMRPLAMRRYFVPSVRAEGLVERFAEVCTANKAEYAITHEAAGQRYAPFLSTVSQVRCRLLVGPAAERVLGALDARFVDRGANLAVIEVKSSGELLFRELVNGTWLASPVQVYLDLMRGEGRAREMAKHLRHERAGILMGEARDIGRLRRSVHGRLRARSCDVAAWAGSLEGIGISGRRLDAEIPGDGQATVGAGACRHAGRGYRHRPADPGRHRRLSHARGEPASDEVRAVDERQGPEAFMAVADPAPKAVR